MKTVSDIRNHAHFGRTIEVNLLGETKVCGFDCVYCNLGESKIRMSRIRQEANFSNATEVIGLIGAAVSKAARESCPIETVLISGNGEPTLHPEFPAFVRALLERRRELISSVDTKIVCLTNGDQIEDRDIRDALNLLDSTVLKLDTGSEKSFKKIYRPRSRTSLELLLQHARHISNLSIQTVVIGGDEGLLNPAKLDDWIEVVAMLNPKSVYLSRAVAPFADPMVQPVSEDDVHRISHWLDRRLKIKAQVEFDSAA